MLRDFADYLTLPGAAVRNVLAGRPGQAFRNVADIFGRLPDAVLPGDLIPDASRPEDDARFEDTVVGSWAKGLPTPVRAGVNFLGDTLTDPLVVLGGAPAVKQGWRKAATAVGEGINAIPGMESIRLATGNARLPNVGTEVLATERLSNAAADSLHRVVTERLAQRPPEIQQAAFEAINNIVGAPGEVRLLDAERRTGLGSTVLRKDVEREAVLKAAQAHPLWKDRAEELTAAIDEALPVAHANMEEAVRIAGWRKPKGWRQDSGDFVTADEYRQASKALRDEMRGVPTTEKARLRASADADPQMQSLNAELEKARADATEVSSANSDVVAKAREDFKAMRMAFAKNSPTLEEFKAQLASALDPVLQAKERVREVRTRIAARRQELMEAMAQGQDPSAVLMADLGRRERKLRAITTYTDADLNPLRVKEPGTKGAGKISRRPLEEMPPDYAQAFYTPRVFKTEGRLKNDAGRNLPTAEALKDFLNNPEHLAEAQGLERQLANAWAYRVQGHAQSIRRAGVGRIIKNREAAKIESDLLAQGASPDEVAAALRKNRNWAPGKTINPSTGKVTGTDGIDAVLEAVEKNGGNAELGITREEARYLKEIYHGPHLSNKFLGLLARSTAPFRQAAVYGVVVPRISGIVVNRLTGIPQLLGAAPGQLVSANAARAAEDILSAVVEEGLGKPRGSTRISQVLKWADDAAAKGHSMSEMVGWLRSQSDDMAHKAADALESGVISGGFVSAEMMLDEIKAISNNSKVKKVWEFPQRIYQGVENRMRLGTFLDILDGGVEGMQDLSAAQAAQKVVEWYYDYGYKSKWNRVLRTVFPFSQFTFQAVPSELRKVVSSPRYAGIMANAVRQDPDAPEYLRDRVGFKINDEATGPDNYLSIPTSFEALGAIPNIFGADPGDELMRGIVSRTAPPIKLGLSYAMNRDPFTGGRFGEDARNPFTGESDDFGRTYRTLAGTGLIQPLTTPIQEYIEPITKADSLGEAVWSMAGKQMGFRPAQADPETTKRRALEAQLERSNARRFVNYASDNPEEQALISELQAIRQARKDRATPGL